MKKDSFDISGMSCAACSNRIHNVVCALNGVSRADVNLLKNDMNVFYDETQVSANDIVRAVDSAGYGAKLRGGDALKRVRGNDEACREEKNLKIRLILSLILTGTLMYVSSKGAGIWGGEGYYAAASEVLTQLLLTLSVVFINYSYYRSGIKALISAAPNMDSLITVGSGSAVIYGIYSLYALLNAAGQGDAEAVAGFASNLYFESAAMILTLISLGKYFEAKAKGKTSQAVEKLLRLSPLTATVIKDGKEITVPVEDVCVGDILAVKAGETIPVDGTVIEGSASTDESALTGESMPKEKKPGDKVIGGTLSVSGHILMQATGVKENTVLSEIIRLVDEATSSKAPIARLADKISGIFVPVVILISIITAIVWLVLGYGTEFALSAAISVLVISCPCALGLATPTAIMVGSGRGASKGILFKSASALETSARITAIVFDKTGTVTEGHPVVTDIIAANGKKIDDVLRYAASLEKLSAHPLGEAVIKEAEKRSLSLLKADGFMQIPGQGISGTIDRETCMAGNAKMMQEEGILNTLSETGNELSSEGKTPLFCAKGGELLGVIAVADAVKPTSFQAVSELKAMGLETVLLTGDNARAAEAVRRETGIDRVISEMLPQDKEREVRRLQEQGKIVAMVGDGINDAPALARSDVGIAVGAGTDVAIESADVVLMKNDLMDVVSSVQLGRAVLRNIRQNLFWAFFYNIISIPVAAGALYGFGIMLSPAVAAAAMSCSSLSVVANALRLRHFRPRFKFSVSVEDDESDALPPVMTEKKARPVHQKTSSTTMKSRSFNMIKNLSIEGMHCEHCVQTATKALMAVNGVERAVVNLETKKAVVETDGTVTNKRLKEAIANVGFEVTEIQDQF